MLAHVVMMASPYVNSARRALRLQSVKQTQHLSTGMGDVTCHGNMLQQWYDQDPCACESDARGASQWALRCWYANALPGLGANRRSIPKATITDLRVRCGRVSRCGPRSDMPEHDL